ncbi:MAG: hypothetical protein P4K83_01335 [Terracidiphilus sp.]|nr:hypothetical protein [Terracidiphilus sp.]
MATISSRAGRQNTSPEQAQAVLSELDAILTSSSFSGSKCSQNFLEFIVKCAIAGDYENLTERFLGTKLFGRPIDYETATDSIVRVRASDVRRRLTQYYSEQHLSSGVTIELTAGHYIPEFICSVTEKSQIGRPLETTLLDVKSSPDAEEPPKRNRFAKIHRVIKPLTAAVVLLILTGILIVLAAQLFSAPNRALEQFWQPIFDEKHPVTLYFGGNYSFWVSPDLKQLIEKHPPSILIKDGQIIENTNSYVSVGNIRAATSIVSLLAKHGVISQLRWPDEVQNMELDRNDVVFIGAYSNPWTISLNRNLRFSFETVHTASETTWMIRDHNRPDTKWSTTKMYPQPIDHDYALITRIIEPERNRVVMSVGGFSQFGTEAAAEFLSDGAAMAEFSRNAPKGWRRKNIQIVLEMEISDNRAVRPRIIATNIW